MWDEITDPFPNFNGATDEVWEWMRNFMWLLIRTEIELNHISKRGPRPLSTRNHKVFKKMLNEICEYV